MQDMSSIEYSFRSFNDKSIKIGYYKLLDNPWSRLLAASLKRSL